MTLEEGCNKYLDNCRSQKLCEETINHYTDAKLTSPLKKPNIKKCSFIEHQCCVRASYLFSLLCANAL
jgi:hypothetical protein